MLCLILVGSFGFDWFVFYIILMAFYVRYLLCFACFIGIFYHLIYVIEFTYWLLRWARVGPSVAGSRRRATRNDMQCGCLDYTDRTV